MQLRVHLEIICMRVCVFVGELRPSRIDVQVKKENTEVLWFVVTLATGLMMTICASYHSPKPIYELSNFKTLLENNINCLLDNDPDSIFVHTGDLNKLNTVELQLQQGLEQIVKVPTHNKHILDQFITNRPDLFNVHVAQSLVKTKHKALIIISKADCVQANSHPQRAMIEICNYTPLTSCLLRQELANYNWSSLIAAIDNKTDSIDDIYDDFVHIVKWHVNCIVPRRKVSIRERDPSYITPRIKLLLSKRIKHRRSDKNEQADYRSKDKSPYHAKHRVLRWLVRIIKTLSSSGHR